MEREAPETPDAPPPETITIEAALRSSDPSGKSAPHSGMLMYWTLQASTLGRPPSS